jgi:phage regulator Rha-like protein
MKNKELTKQTTMTSLEIAELTGKSHDNLLKSIRAMEVAWVKVTGVKFNASEFNGVNYNDVSDIGIAISEFWQANFL